METIKTEYGKVNVPKDTIKNLIRIHIADIKGLVGSKKTIMKELADIFRGKENNHKKSEQSLKIEIKKGLVIIDLFIILKHGVRIPDIAWEIQNKIKELLKQEIEVENVVINIHVQGIQFSKKMQSKEELIASNLFVRVF